MVRAVIYKDDLRTLGLAGSTNALQ